MDSGMFREIKMVDVTMTVICTCTCSRRLPDNLFIETSRVIGELSKGCARIGLLNTPEGVSLVAYIKIRSITDLMCKYLVMNEVFARLGCRLSLDRIQNVQGETTVVSTAFAQGHYAIFGL